MSIFNLDSIALKGNTATAIRLVGPSWGW